MLNAIAVVAPILITALVFGLAGYSCGRREGRYEAARESQGGSNLDEENQR